MTKEKKSASVYERALTNPHTVLYDEDGFKAIVRSEKLTYVFLMSDQPSVPRYFPTFAMLIKNAYEYYLRNKLSKKNTTFEEMMDEAKKARVFFKKLENLFED